MVTGPPPQSTFSQQQLIIRTEPAGAIWHRLYQTRFPDPLGYGLAKSRFSDPSGTAFGLIYLGSTIKVCFHEAILRDRTDARSGALLIKFSELEAYSCAMMSVRVPLKLVDLTEDNPARMGVPSDVVGARDQTVAQQWSTAFHAHPIDVDGVFYPSRLGETRNIALYERAIRKMTPIATPQLVDLREDLAAIIDHFSLEIV